MVEERDGGAQLVRRALAGDSSAFRPLVELLTPVVQVRVARALVRSRSAREQGRDLRQHVEDFTQDVFVALFADDGRALRSWDPARGLSLRNFVGLVTEHQVASILRSGRQNPWTEEPTVDGELDASAGRVATSEERVHSREVLDQPLDRLSAELSPRGMQFFQLLVVEERTAEEVCTATGLNAEAVYAWRSRLGKVVRRLAEEIETSPSDLGGSRRNPKGQQQPAR